MSYFKTQYISVNKNNQIVARGKVNNDTLPVKRHILGGNFSSKDDAIRSIFSGILSGEFQFTRANKNDFNVVYRSSLYDWYWKQLDIQSVDKNVLADMLLERYKEYKKNKKNLRRVIVEVAPDKYLMPYKREGMSIMLGMDKNCIFQNKEVAKSFIWGANIKDLTILELPKKTTEDDLTDCMRCEESFVPNRIIRTMFGLEYQDEFCNRC